MTTPTDPAVESPHAPAGDRAALSATGRPSGPVVAAGTRAPRGRPAVPGHGALAIRKGDPAPAATLPDLLRLLADAGCDEHVAEATATWLVSGRRRSKRTRDGYIKELAWWAAYWHARGVRPHHVTPTQADQYAAVLAAAGLANATCARRLAGAASWYRYLIRAEQATTNPLQDMERPETGRTRSRGISVSGMARLLLYAKRHETPRTYALLTLLYDTGGRIGSVLAITLEDLGHDNGHPVVDLTVKGGKLHRQVLAPPAVAAIEACRTHRSEQGHPDHGLLFCTRTGKALDEPYAWRLVRRVAKAAGVNDHDKISPHTFRRAAITHALNLGHELRDVQDFAGHARPDTTRGYDTDQNNLDRSPAPALAAAMAAEINRLAKAEAAG